MKTFVLTLSIFIALFLVGVAVTPELLSTQRGTQFLFQTIAPRFGLQATAAQLDLNWLGPQKVEGFKLNDGSVEIKSLEVSNSLFSLIFFPNYIRDIMVDQPQWKIKESLPKSSPSVDTDGSKETIQKRSLPTLAGEIKIREGRVVIESAGKTPVELNDITFDFHPDKQRIRLDAHTLQNQVKGDVVISGAFGERIHLVAEVEGFPTKVIDELLQTTLISEAIGDQLTIKIEGEKTGDKYPISTSISSQNLQATLSGEITEGKLVLSTSSQVNYTLNPDLLEKLTVEKTGVSWRTNRPQTLSVRFQEGVIPLDFKHFDPSKLKLLLSTELDSVVLNSSSGESLGFRDLKGEARFKNGLELSLSGEMVVPERGHFSANFSRSESGHTEFQFHTTQITLSEFQTLKPYAPALNPVLGTKAEVTLKGEQTEEGAVQMFLQFTSSEARIEGEVRGNSWKDVKWKFSGERRSDLQWEPMVGERIYFDLQGNSQHIGTVLQLKNIRGRLYNPLFDLNLNAEYTPDQDLFSIDDLKLTGLGKLIKPPKVLEVPHFNFDTGNLSLSFSGKEQTLKLDLQIRMLDEENQPHPLNAKLTASQFIKGGRFDLSQIKAVYSVDLQRFPTKALDQFLPEGIDLQPLIGSSLTLQSKGKLEQGSENWVQCKIDAEAPGFSGHSEFVINAKGELKQKEVTVLHWEMTPLRYSNILSLFTDEMPPFRLNSTSQITVALPEITLTAAHFDSFRSLFSTVGVNATIQSDPLYFIHRLNGEQFTIDRLSGKFSSPSFSKLMHVEGAGNFITHDQESDSRFSAVVEALNLWTPEGRLDHENFSLSQEIRIQNAPVSRLLGLLPMTQQLRDKTTALLGERLSMEVLSQVAYGTGPIQVSVSSSNVDSHLPLYLDKGSITLRNYVEASVRVTPAVSESFLMDINPLLFGNVQTEHPVKFYIAPKGFFCPIWITSLKDINIERAILDIGRIRIQKGRGIQELMKFLKSRESNQEYIDAWLTPIFMSFKDGSGFYERFDMLLGQDVHIAFWGKVDWLKGKVWMTLGIAPKTLQQKFNLIGLSKKDMFQVKMRGTTSKVELDWSSAYTRIGILVARLAGGHIGYLLGGVVEQLITVLGEEPTPPPTTQPFPWESRDPPQSNSEIPEIAPPPSATQQGTKKILEFLIP
jgi:hypothetical protein